MREERLRLQNADADQCGHAMFIRRSHFRQRSHAAPDHDDISEMNADLDMTPPHSPPRKKKRAYEFVSPSSSSTQRPTPTKLRELRNKKIVPGSYDHYVLLMQEATLIRYRGRSWWCVQDHI